MGFETALWRSLEVRFNPAKLARTEVEKTIAQMEATYPKATDGITPDVFIGLTRRNDGVLVAGVNKPRRQGTHLIENNGPKEDLFSLFREIAQYFDDYLRRQCKRAS